MKLEITLVIVSMHLDMMEEIAKLVCVYFNGFDVSEYSIGTVIGSVDDGGDDDDDDDASRNIETFPRWRAIIKIAKLCLKQIQC